MTKLLKLLENLIAVSSMDVGFVCRVRALNNANLIVVDAKGDVIFVVGVVLQ